jgi:hypothetical protein
MRRYWSKSRKEDGVLIFFCHSERSEELFLERSEKSVLRYVKSMNRFFVPQNDKLFLMVIIPINAR